ncbi:DUF6850 family outer membrane beta-barrel protein [Sphingobacterium sp. UBA6645]|uniref:DUF6850 family outer membrane beta-barrel protein n=1 Tax=Sphingobacterium sp. UBA6645 TaxID=1947511 RepID=UPI0025D72AD1|nr:DUF6850 family outer membrane beta-barrel protein [Sphingobacterium sp. UBA6645]
MSIPYNNLYKILSLSACFAWAMPSLGQEGNHSIIEQEQEIEYLQWEHSQNAAGLQLDKPKQHSSLAAGYKKTDGNFRRPQAGESMGNLHLYTRGNVYLKKGYLQGYFDYSRNNIRNAEYNSSLIDPFREMPYVTADTNASDWLNQHYKIGFKASSAPIAEKLHLGLGANFIASSGAKQRDIRTVNRYYQLDLQPSLSYSLNDQHHLGANFMYKNFKEEANNSNSVTHISQGYFALLGLGNSISGLGAGRTMNYQGDAFGGGVQYQYQSAINVFLNANYTVQAEDANITFSNPRPGGSILMKKWDASLHLQKDGEAFLHGFKAYLLHSNMNGIEYINEFISGTESEGFYTRFQSVRSKYKCQAVSGRYELLRKSGDAYNWKAAAILRYNKLDDRYLIPASQMFTENMGYGLEGHKLFSLSANLKSQLSLGVRVLLNNNLDAAYEYSGADAETLPVMDLEQRNYQFYKADYQQFEVPIYYAQQLRSNSNVQVFVKGNLQLIKTNSFTFNDRKHFNLSIGATF